MKKYTFWIDIELINKVKIVVKSMGMNVSTFFRIAIIEKLNKLNEKM